MQISFYKFLAVFILFLCLRTSLQAQYSIAQLEKLVENQPTNRLKINNLNYLATLLKSKNHQKALKYAQEAQRLSIQIHYAKGLAMAYANQGETWVNIGGDKDEPLHDYEKAAEFYRKAFQFYRGLHEKGIINRAEILAFLEGGVITVYQDLADIYYSDKQDFRKAAEAYRMLSTKFEEYALAIRDFGLDKVLKRLKDEKMKERLLQQDLEKQLLKSKLLKDELSKKELARQVAENRERIAQDSIHKIQLKDSLEISKQKLARDKATQENKLKAAQLKQQRILFFASLGGIVLVLVLAFVLFRDSRRQKGLNQELTKQRNTLAIKNKDIEQKNREIATNRDEIQDKNTQITESINYAQRIQAAMLPTLQRIRAALPQSFVYYKPRDIVSGDFYWFAELPPTHGLKVPAKPGDLKTSAGTAQPDFIIAALDCTGHGVPGAFMSMVGNSLLNEIVTQKNITAPHLILSELNHSIRLQLQQKESRNQDGMDACICKVSPQNNTIEFAGANNPLYYIHHNETHTVKGDRFGVGGLGDDLDRKYELHTLELQEGMTFYLSSDGYRDQLGGPKDKKFMSKKFKALLLEMSSLPFDKQAEILDKNIQEWMDYPCKYDLAREQTDDVLVIGFRV